jgi:hypothetical protein
METRQVNNALEKLFREEGARIVFWNDPDKEFTDYVSGQLLSPVQGVQAIRLDQTSALEIELLVEREQPESRFVIYSAKKEPNYESDWLLDIEVQTYDEELRHYAHYAHYAGLCSAIDLKDGNKVNYGRFGDLLEELRKITGKEP